MFASQAGCAFSVAVVCIGCTGILVVYCRCDVFSTETIIVTDIDTETLHTADVANVQTRGRRCCARIITFRHGGAGPPGTRTEQTRLAHTIVIPNSTALSLSNGGSTLKVAVNFQACHFNTISILAASTVHASLGITIMTKETALAVDTVTPDTQEQDLKEPFRSGRSQY